MKTSALKHFTKTVAVTMSAVFAFTLIPMAVGQDTVLAATAGGKDQGNTNLGVSGIGAPVKPSSGDDPWTGSYVYFGKYDVDGDSEKDPIKFRVLAPSTTAYGGSTLFLDSDKTLFMDCFDNTSPYSNSWADSNIRATLNGSFLNGFTDLEKAAIATSTGNGGLTYDPFLTYNYGAPVSVNDQVFLLDASEVMNPAYGYSSDCGWVDKDGDGDWSTGSSWDWHEVANREKGGSSAYWWLRSADSGYDYVAGFLYSEGSLGSYNVVSGKYGVAPALNINQESIIFTTAVENETNAYKLTLSDSNLTIAVPSGQQVAVSGTTVTVPYKIGGANEGNATRASILITDGKWDSAGAKIILYGELGASTASSGTFTLPGNGWSSDYHVYILAEDINDGHDGKETDYASEPVEITMPTCTVTYKVANGTWSDGSTDAVIETVIKNSSPASIPTGMIASPNYEGGSWDTDPSTATISADTTFTYTFDAVPTYTVTVTNDGNGTATADVSSGAEGTEVTLTATPNTGYQFKEWQVVSGGVTITDNKFTIGTSDVTVKAVFEAKPADPVEPTSADPVEPTTADPVTPAEPAEPAPVTVEPATPEPAVEPAKSTGPFTYTVVSGGDATWTEGDPDLVVTVKSDEDGDHSFDRYEYSAIDGTKLTDEQAPASSGSTVITFKSDLLKTLSEGKHTILINFSDNSITTTVTIVKKAAGTTDVPSTGEMIGVTAIAGTVMILSACSMLILMRNKKREEKQ
ncbi:MAG: DUF6273 domain-containing protein [Saccharofermentans sp.]|nr:DUF6273 domain-containing protein [Saccharofermentans sp.]